VPVELDHLFVCTSQGAPEAKYLAWFGLIEGPANVHPGQGTANRRFEFDHGAQDESTDLRPHLPLILKR
jgi:hypothetical protein